MIIKVKNPDSGLLWVLSIGARRVKTAEEAFLYGQTVAVQQQTGSGRLWYRLLAGRFERASIRDAGNFDRMELWNGQDTKG